MRHYGTAMAIIASMAIVSSANSATPTPLIKACAGALIAGEQLDRNDKFLLATQAGLYRDAALATQIANSAVASDDLRRFATRTAQKDSEMADSIGIVLADNYRTLLVVANQMSTCP